MKNLIIRTITGAIFVAFIISSAILSPEAFAVLFLFMAIPAYLEFQRLINKENNIQHTIPGVLTALIVYSLFALYALCYTQKESLWLIVPVVAILTSIIVLTHKQYRLRYILSNVGGIILVVSPLALLNLYLNPELIPGYHTPWFLLGMFVILWMHDTFAYLTGSLFGRHPLYKRISPKKSWEGSIGGFGFAIIAAYIISIFSPVLECWHWITIAIIVTIFGTIGDLAESWLKRRAGVKDSGSILPGHGGVLDRFDSILLVSPIVYLLILFAIS